MSFESQNSKLASNGNSNRQLPKAPKEGRNKKNGQVRCSIDVSVIYIKLIKYCSDAMDSALMSFVNTLGAIIMVSIVAFHYMTATEEDAETN